MKTYKLRFPFYPKRKAGRKSSEVLPGENQVFKQKSSLSNLEGYIVGQSRANELEALSSSVPIGQAHNDVTEQQHCCCTWTSGTKVFSLSPHSISGLSEYFP